VAKKILTFPHVHDTTYHQYFPADYMLVVMITLYMFWATTKGIISIGIRLLCVNLYKFRRAATEPQGLLAATMLLMLSLAGLSYTLTMSVAPEYSMFGSQKYVSSPSASESFPTHVFIRRVCAKA